MSNETRIQINTGLLVFSLTSLVTVAVAWGAMSAGQSQLKDLLQQYRNETRADHERVITHEEKISGLERRVSAVERKTGLAGQSAGEVQMVDRGAITNDNF